jgi:cytochrome c oxidase subunit III
MPDSAIAERVGVAGSGGGGGSFASGGGSGGPGASHTPQRAYLTGMAIALSGIAMFFMALVSAAVVRRGSPSGDWQPLQGTHALWRLLWLNTAVLLASSFTLAHARSRARHDDEDGFRHWWGVTAILGVLFLAGQLLAWRQLAASGVYMATNPSSSFFYLFTAAHGLHLTAGIVALLVVAFRPVRRLARETAVDVAAMYWHAMGGIWVFLFLFLLIERRG